MKYSFDWMKEHIGGKLPDPEELRRVVTMNAFEVEEAETWGTDTVFDIKVLPDRAHDALSHRGIAREIAALVGLPRVAREVSVSDADASVPSVRVDVKDGKRCSRYIGVRVDGAKAAASPRWLKEKLESVGQRSINVLVDLTNFVLLDIGQPMHAFDAAKVKGGITVRLAEKGETMMTLDNKALAFDSTELVIADDESVLALAGVKGGKKAEVDSGTESIIVESANFDPTLTRRTSTKYGIKTDASKRYENGITSAFALEGMSLFLSLLKKEQPSVRIGRATDCYPEPESWIYKVGVSAKDINRTLGTAMADDDVAAILKRLGYTFEYLSLEEALVKHIPDLLGKPYKNPSSMRQDAPESFSCSSLVSYLFTLAGIAMPSISVDKYVYGKKVEKEHLQCGDLVFSNTGEGKIYYETVEYVKGTTVPEGVDHVGIYLGEGKVLHASKSTSGVAVEELAASKQFSNIVGYRRVAGDAAAKRFVVSVPPERLDLRITEDLIEEIGRHYGYDKIVPAVPKLETKGVPNKRLYYANKARKFLIEKGFSEVYTYSFAITGEGDVEVLNPIGKDRPFLRSSLAPDISRALKMNFFNAPLIGTEEVKIFEFGNVFWKSAEHTSFALGIHTSNKKRMRAMRDELQEIISGLESALGTDFGYEQAEGGAEKDVIEIDFDSTIQSLLDPSEYKPLAAPDRNVVYKASSAYPFIVRDIALFVPADVSEERPAEIIRNAAGELAVRFSRFDKFQKPGDDRISYAYRLVFQAFNRTLTDDEINPIMVRVTDACAKEGWEVR